MSPPGRPKGEYRRAQPEGTPVNPPGRPKGEEGRGAGADQVDLITARLRAEDARLRRRTVWMTLVPVVVGLGMLLVAWVGVDRAQQRRDRLDQERTELQAEIGAMKAERVALDRENKARQELLAQAASRLSERDQIEVARLQQGLELAKGGDNAAAVRNYDQAIQRNEGNPLAYRLRGQALYAEGQHEQAIASLQQALRIDPADAEAHYTLALAQWALGRQDEAVAEIRLAFRDNDLKARALQDPAYRPIRAYEDTRVGLASGDSAREKDWIDRGLKAARQGDFPAAVQAYGQALAINGDNWRVLNWQGYALYRDKQPAKAVESLERAAVLAPKQPEVHYNLALALQAAGRPEDAGRALERAYAADPDYRVLVERDPQSRALRNPSKR